MNSVQWTPQFLIDAFNGLNIEVAQKVIKSKFFGENNFLFGFLIKLKNL